LPQLPQGGARMRLIETKDLCVRLGGDMVLQGAKCGNGALK